MSANKIKSYNGEIQGLLRESAIKSDLIKDFKATDEGYLQLLEAVKAAQAAAKDYLEEFENAGEVIAEKKAVDKQIKLAMAAAAEGTEYEDKEKFKLLSKYYKSRCKGTVENTIDVGKEFFILDDIVGG